MESSSRDRACICNDSVLHQTRGKGPNEAVKPSKNHRPRRWADTNDKTGPLTTLLVETSIQELTICTALKGVIDHAGEAGPITTKHSTLFSSPTKSSPPHLPSKKKKAKLKFEKSNTTPQSSVTCNISKAKGSNPPQVSCPFRLLNRFPAPPHSSWCGPCTRVSWA